MSAKVSIIVPIYAVENYIERCANSLFAQTLDSIEFIFIDDCTPDRSMEVLNVAIENNRPRFTGMNWNVLIERMPMNSGLAAVRRRGIQLASGEYTIHCDSDDWVDCDICRLLYQQAKKENADIVICDFYKVTENTQKHIQGCNRTDKEGLIKDLLTERTSWSVCNKIIKTTLYRENDIVFPEDNMGEDMALVMQLMLKAKRISYLPQPLYYYYYNPASISHQPSVDAVFRRYQHLLNNTRIVLSSFVDSGLDSEYETELQLLKWNVCSSLCPITRHRKYRAIWRNTFPEIFPSILFSPFLKVSDKLRIILILLMR